MESDLVPPLLPEFELLVPAGAPIGPGGLTALLLLVREAEVVEIFVGSDSTRLEVEEEGVVPVPTTPPSSREVGGAGGSLELGMLLWFTGGMLEGMPVKS